jgi:hypothetical protein
MEGSPDIQQGFLFLQPPLQLLDCLFSIFRIKSAQREKSRSFLRKLYQFGYRSSHRHPEEIFYDLPLRLADFLASSAA